MGDAEGLTERTERLLAQVETLQKAMARLQGELLTHSEALREQLAGLRALPEAEEETPAASAPQARDRRSEPRRKGNLVAVHISDAQATAPPIEGWVVDRSQGGLGVLVDEAVALGTILSVRPVKTRPPARWIQIEVKSCRQERNSWNLGCQFVQRPGWNDLRHFG